MSISLHQERVSAKTSWSTTPQHVQSARWSFCSANQQWSRQSVYPIWPQYFLLKSTHFNHWFRIVGYTSWTKKPAASINAVTRYRTIAVYMLDISILHWRGRTSHPTSRMQNTHKIQLLICIFYIRGKHHLLNYCSWITATYPDRYKPNATLKTLFTSFINEFCLSITRPSYYINLDH